MQPPGDPADDDLVGALARVLAEADPVPDDVRLAARRALESRTLDAELAAVVHDSIIGDSVVRVPAGARARAVTFEAPALTIEIETEPQSAAAGHAVRLVGRLIPPQRAEIAIRNGDALLVTRADDRGRFGATGLSPGQLSLRCRLSDGALVETSWLTI